MPIILVFILLGIVEGITEFLPVSSTGHLILANALLGYDPETWKVFNVVIQLGAMMAVVVLYWRTFVAVIMGLVKREPGAFAFVHRKDAPKAGVLDPPRDLVGLVFEGVRRHDEWKRSAALVGDGARFVATGAARNITTDEPADLVEALWAAASSGSTARECDTKVAVDSHRVRRLLASWVEIDALKLA